MRFARLLHENQPVWAILDGDLAYRVHGDIYNSPVRGEPLGKPAAFKLLNPIGPTGKCLCLLGAWRDSERRDGPGFIVKPPSTMIATGDVVIYPDIAVQVNLEPELGVVIGKRCSRVTAGQAAGHILGYTAVNDVTAFETTVRTNFPPLFGKCFDTFGVIGPCVVPDLDPRDITIRGAINGEMFVEANTRDLVWDVYQVVSWVSQVVTLFPGDVISMGAPPGFDRRQVLPGDQMSVSIQGIGSISNPVLRTEQLPVGQVFGCGV